MPDWVTYILSAAAVVTAIGVLFQKVFRPTVRAAAAADEMLPLVRELTNQFRGKPYAFAVLDDIASEFRTDSGSSLRDVINRIEEAGKVNAAMGEANAAMAVDLRVGVEAVKVVAAQDRALAMQDRATLALLVKELDRVVAKVDRSVAGISRIEAGAEVVATDLAAERASEADK